MAAQVEDVDVAWSVQAPLDPTHRKALLTAALWSHERMMAQTPARPPTPGQGKLGRNDVSLGPAGR